MKAAVVLVAIAACGPNLGMLARDHHDREAVCGAHDGASGARARIARALAEQANPLVFADEVPQASVARVAGGPPLAARFVRVSVQTSILPVDALDVSVAIRGGAAVDWNVLAGLTGEALPAKREVETYVTAGNTLRALGAFFTVGLALPYMHFTPGTELVDAPDEEYARKAPRAHALHEAMEQTGCTNPGWEGEGAGARCRWFFAVPPGQPLVLELELAFSADRVDRSGERGDDRCTIRYVTAVELGPAEGLDRVFAGTWRSLGEIGLPR